MKVSAALFVVLLWGVAVGLPGAQAADAKAMRVDGEIALSALMALGDGHLKTMAVSLQTLAAGSDAKSADWAKIKAPLGQLSKMNVPALLWFALPDGSYWNLDEGRAKGNLATRAYWPKVLSGETVIGDLVVSTATRKSVAIVAVPVREGGKVVGVLGSSIYLDQVSAMLEKQMGLDETMIFYSFDAQPLLALEWDRSLIFKDPLALTPEVRGAFLEMMKKDQGVITYPFRGKERTVIFRKSKVTDWWYVFGLVPEGRGKQAAQ